MQKAKQKAVTVEKELRELMEYLDVPTGTIMADSQGAGSFGEKREGRGVAGRGHGATAALSLVSSFSRGPRQIA